MDLKQLEYIIAIAEEQSIAKAAQKLFMTQSGLNQQLLKLERDCRSSTASSTEWSPHMRGRSIWKPQEKCF